MQTVRDRQRAVNRGFKWVLIASFVLHFGVFGAVVFAQSQRPAVVVKDAIPVELVQLGKPRDPDLLPRKVRRAPPPPDDGVNLDTGKKPKTKPKRKRDPDKAMSDAARRLLNDANDSALDNAFSKLDEPEGSPDGVARGTTTDPTRAARGYEAQVGASLKQAYRLPETLKSRRQFLSAEFVLFIESNGRIARYEIVKSHPERVFMSALENLLKSHQLPAPPKALAKRYRDQGVRVRFKP